MGKSIISMAMFNSYFDITRGYFLMAQVMWGISPGEMILFTIENAVTWAMIFVPIFVA